MSDSKSATKVTTKQKAATTTDDTEAAKTAQSEVESSPEDLAPIPVVEQETASPVVTATPPVPEQPPAPVVVTPPVPPPLSRDALTVASMLDEYKQLMSPVIVTPTAIKKAIIIMSRICDVICESQHDDARDVMLEFHRTHKAGLMREEMGLRGIRSLLKNQAMRVATVYSMYRHKTIDTGLTQDSNIVRKYTSQTFVLYMDAR